MTIDGSILIGGAARQRVPYFQAHDPAQGRVFGPGVSTADTTDVVDACALAATAFPNFSTLSPGGRAGFLEAVADAIVAIGDELVVTAMAEAGLPRVRLEGERGRTCGQLRMFAAELRQGYWLDATIDPALPDRTPPRADLRRMNVAVGPVAVFGASNFPLAFSVAGGDTAAAFAAGCPVVAKGHPAHPGTGELVARAIGDAVRACGLDAGVFSYLPGATHELGEALVADPRIKAVGFTGSRSGGLALMGVAQRRPEPIPVHAEMSSINPVVLLPAALASRGAALAQGFVGSLTLGAGQFCTNPGLVLGLDGSDLDAFVVAAAVALETSAPAVMLTPGIAASYAAGVARLSGNGSLRQHAGTAVCDQPNRGVAALFETDAATLISNPTIAEEVFGASALVVRCADLAELARVVTSLEGQLTATLHFDAADESIAVALLPLLQDRVGRVLANGWPTGVEVTRAMVHGGPFPATSDGRTTSVGTLAMQRFLRPVCYQDLPDALLPPALRSDNPWTLPRRVEGAWEYPA